MDTLIPLLQDHIMAILFDTLITFKSVNEILCCYYILYSDENSQKDLLHKNIYFLGFMKRKWDFFRNLFKGHLLGVKVLIREQNAQPTLYTKLNFWLSSSETCAKIVVLGPSCEPGFEYMPWSAYSKCPNCSVG